MRRLDWDRLRRRLADAWATLVVGGVVVGLLAGLGWVVWQNVRIQQADHRARHEASQQRAAALLEAFSAIPAPATETEYRDAIEQARDPLRAERITLARYANQPNRVDLTVKVEEQYVPLNSAYIAWTAFCYTYRLPREGTADYREIECPVEKPLICKALGEDCKIFGLGSRMP